jgi:hypothetical protein
MKKRLSKLYKSVIDTAASDLIEKFDKKFLDGESDKTIEVNITENRIGKGILQAVLDHYQKKEGYSIEDNTITKH